MTGLHHQFSMSLATIGTALGAVRCTSLRLLRAHRKLVTIAAAEIGEIIDKIERVQRGKEEVL